MNWTDGLLVIAFATVFGFGFIMGYTWRQERKVNTEAEVRYHCCDHCYSVTDGHLVHGTSEIDNHRSECMEYVLGKPCEAGSKRV